MGSIPVSFIGLPRCHSYWRDRL